MFEDINSYWTDAALQRHRDFLIQSVMVDNFYTSPYSATLYAGWAMVCIAIEEM